MLKFSILEIQHILKEVFGNQFYYSGPGLAEKQKEDGNEPITEITQLLTDSRNHFNPKETVFFAIHTPGGNDGHKFIKNLYDKGVRYFVVQSIPEDLSLLSSAHFFIVEDSIKALAAISGSQRTNAREILAITGSRGKTTVKEILFQLLEPIKRISRSPRSYNSKIGVPLSLWQIPKDTELAIIEAGISKKGEMQFLSDLISPDTVIITNIGEAHAQGFASMEEKAAEKVKLANGENVKTIIYPKDSKIIEEALEPLKKTGKLIGWSLEDPSAPLYLQIIDNQIKYQWKGETNTIEAVIEKPYDVENYASALAFLLYYGISPEEIKKRFQKLRRINTRLNVSEGVNGCSVILDSYTSDLSSLLPAIDFMTRRKMPGQTPSLIISDLLFEGKDIEETYREISKLVKETGIRKFIGIGPSLKAHASLFPPNSFFYSTTEEFLDHFSPSDHNEEIILLKGSPEFGFERIHQQLEARNHETVLEVNLDAILRNYNYFRSKIPSQCGIIAMVKASGYGAGSYEIAKTLQDAGAAFLAVAALDEGIDLRRNGITMPIMVMNPKAANYRALFHNKLEPVIYSMPMLRTLISEAHRYGLGEYPVHIKLDTGMHRMGFLQEELPELISLLKGGDGIKVASIFSHLATADCLDMDQYTLLQLNRFEEMSDNIIKGLGYTIKRHILNTAGILRFPQYHYDLVRLGIGLYGADTLPPEIEKPLSPVSTLRSVIICLRDVEEGEAVGYSRKGEIYGKRKIATIPVGYADGINRKFGNGAMNVMINGKKAPTIGNICMDATMIDVTGIDCKEGDSVEIFGNQMPLKELAETLDTIPYEVLTSVSPRVKRVYYRE